MDLKKYSKLRENFKILVEKTINALGPINYQELERINLHLSLFHGTKGVIIWGEYIDVIKEIQRHPEIKNHFDCLIGSAEGQRLISGTDFVQAFLAWCIWGTTQFDENDFDQKFQSFVSFFNSSTIELVKECKLYNFNSFLHSIDLDNELKISKVAAAAEKFKPNTGYEVFSDLGFVMVQKYNVEKLVMTQEESQNEANQNDRFKKFDTTLKSVHQNFDLFIQAVRVHKHSACYRDHNVKSYFSGFFGQFGQVVGSSFFTNTAIGIKYELEDHEIEDLKAIWRQLGQTDKRGTLSANRLTYVSDRRNKEDKVLDCFIGLESLYLPDGNAELTFRLSLRVAKILISDAIGQKELFQFIKSMYGKRSKLAHGDNVEISNQELEKLESTLRLSLKKYLSDKSTFSEDDLNQCFFT